MDRLILTPSQARKIILHAAGLTKRAQFGKGKEAVYKLIDHLGFVQIDTIYVVERAHHHAIASRVPGYKPEWLEQLQADRVHSDERLPLLAAGEGKLFVQKKTPGAGRNQSDEDSTRQDFAGGTAHGAGF